MDYHASTPVDPRIAQAVYRHLREDFGNGSSQENIHGQTATEILELAKIPIAKLTQVPPEEIVFTSGATEAIAVAILGLARAKFAASGDPISIALAPLEHRSLLDAARYAETLGIATLEFLDVDSEGQVDLDQVEKLCKEGLDLLCLMAANNEIGTVYPLETAGSITTANGTLLFVDASQGAGRIPIRAADWGVDLLVLSGHKMYGPKGVGALVTARGVKIVSPFSGRSAREHLRPGTPNTPAIVGLGLAAEFRQLEMDRDEAHIAGMRDRLQSALTSNIDELVVNGDQANRLAGNLHISIGGIPAQAVLARVRKVLSISTGSACTSGIEEPSHVLKAIGLRHDLAEGSLRFGLGKYTSADEVELAAEVITSAVQAVRKSLQRV